MQGTLLLHQVSSDEGVTWRTIVCAQGGRVRVNTNVTSESTKCGAIKGIGKPDWVMSGDAVANFEPEADEVSLNELMEWIQNTTNVRMRVLSPAEGSFAVGEKYYREGAGYFSTDEEDISDATPVKFSWEFQGSGPLATRLVAVEDLETPIAQAVGTTLSIDADVSGGSEPYAYQWQKGGVDISGATSATFTKANAQVSDSGSYTVEVTDAGGITVESSASVVTIS